MPEVSIGIPVYNGAKLVSRAIESALEQTHTDFELLISDNCSSDDTEEVCRRYARQDSRVVYTKTGHNLGAAGNFSRLARIARGTFFKWLGHDDWMAPNFIERCLPIARTNPDVISVIPIAQVMDAQGTMALSISPRVTRSAWSTAPLERYRQMMDELAYCETHQDGMLMIACVYGFHRLSRLLETRLVMPFISSDIVLAAELSLFGKLIQLDDALNFFPVASNTSQSFQAWDPSAMQTMLAPALAKPRDVQVSVRRRHFEHVRAVLRSPLAASEKVLALEAATRPMRARFATRLGVPAS